MSGVKHVTIVGGGVIGLCCAYFLLQKGHRVRVVERKTIGNSCATGNAGYVTPSHFIPLAAPGMIKKGIKWMLDPESPFYIHPRADMSLIQWLWKFNQHCNSAHVNKVKQTLYELCSKSKQLHFELAEQIGNSYQLKQRGIYVITQSDAILQEELAIVEQAQSLGLNASEVSIQQLNKQFPQLQLNAKGGIYFPEDAHLQPGEFIAALQNYLISNQVEFIEQVELSRMKVNNNKVTSIELVGTSDGNKVLEDVDELVVASGSWSPSLLQQLNLKIPIQAGKGYSVTIDKPWDIDTPIILSDAAVAITPFDKQIRFGGTMEFAGINHSINQRRVNGILKSVERFIGNFDLHQVKGEPAWSGLRPCSPDGLPLIGRVPSVNNVSLAAGHAMLGLTLAPVTGQIISELVTAGEQCNVANKAWLKHLDVARFG